MVTVDPEFAALCPPLADYELAELEASLLRDGCRDALVVWAGNNVLLDGHNRKRICEQHGLWYETTEVDLPDRAAAVEWIIRNQLGRRNLNPDAAALLRGKLYNSQKHQGERTDLTSHQNDGRLATAQRIASQTGVSAPTIERDGRFAQAVEDLAPYVPDLPQRVMAGDIPSRQAVIEAAQEPEQAPQRLAHVAHNSGDNEWYTPPEYIAAAREVMGAIDLDPASTDIANEVVGAATFYTAEQDGLYQEWGGRVWMNPPYSQPLIGQFCDKLAASLPRIEQAIVLVNNATETRWFAALADLASAICFPSGRVRFWAPDKVSAPLQGQAVLYIGAWPRRFASQFRRFGFIAFMETTGDVVSE